MRMSATELKETDKPFIIAIFLISIFAVLLIAGVIGAAYDKQLVIDYIGEIIGAVITLVTAAITYYFGTKKSN